MKHICYLLKHNIFSIDHGSWSYLIGNDADINDSKELKYLTFAAVFIICDLCFVWAILIPMCFLYIVYYAEIYLIAIVLSHPNKFVQIPIQHHIIWQNSKSCHFTITTIFKYSVKVSNHFKKWAALNRTQYTALWLDKSPTKFEY